MTPSTCTCRARVGERHYRECPLSPAIRQPLTKMEGHPSVYRRPLMSAPEAERFQHRVDVLTGSPCTDDACPDHGMSSPFVSEDGHRD